MLEDAKDYLADFRHELSDQKSPTRTKAMWAAAYVAVVVLTILLAPPGTPDFTYRHGEIEWGTGTRTFLDITAKDDADVTIEVSGVTIEFDGTAREGMWSAKRKLKAGVTERISPEDLSSKNTKHPSSELRIVRVRIYEGDKLVDTHIPLGQ